MTNVSRNSRIDLSIDIAWQKEDIRHKEHYFADNLNCWRDIFPGSTLEKLFNTLSGDPITVPIHPGELVSVHRAQDVHVLPLRNVKDQGLAYGLQRGRYYPKGIIFGLPGIFKENKTPFRCIDITDHHITADLNHPMAGIPMTLSMTVQGKSLKSDERGGSCTDWLELALTGPGMQARQNGIATDFFSGNAFGRRNEHPDGQFYAMDRFVHHIDSKARENLSRFYGTVVKPGDAVLDLMAGWTSHLPPDLELSVLYGLGLNENELKENPRLSDYGVQDLNIDPSLKFQGSTFDVVVCSLSVEYLTDPLAVFQEVGRVLKPGGKFVVTFSNRWFPEKAIHVWEYLHDFERMGLVTEYFQKTNGFESLSTLSMRGYPRPFGDKYFPQLRLSDPIYVVTGKIVK